MDHESFQLSEATETRIALGCFYVALAATVGFIGWLVVSAAGGSIP